MNDRIKKIGEELSKYGFVNPKLVSDGHGEFPDTYQMNPDDVENILEMFTRARVSGLSKRTKIVTEILDEGRRGAWSDFTKAVAIVDAFFPRDLTSADGFRQYIFDARKAFVAVALQYDPSEHNKLRTEIDNLIIAFDQMAERQLEIDKLRHYRDTTVGLWATDRPDKVEDPDKLLFELKD